MYYIKQNEDIVLCDEDLQKLQNTLLFMPQYANSAILQTDEEIISFDSKYYFKKDIQDKLDLKEKERKIDEINLRLEELDKKRIRAICEPSLKDENTTWLEYYNEQISELRTELANL